MLKMKKEVAELFQMKTMLERKERKAVMIRTKKMKKTLMLKTMVSKSVLVLVVLLLFHFPRPVVNGFDEDAQQSKEDLEQAAPEPPEPGWGPLHMAAVQQGPFWAAAELLLVPLFFWFKRRRAAMKQRAAAQRAEEEARKRKMEIEQRKLRFKRRYNDLKEMWRTMNTVKKKMARLF
ncbi:hypothetical protein DV515_00010923 [Chloebia gouldiae]|uniref:Uncharacterized protein n=1 Tax=Chloebia gouldiae TaxID=44316 RepID=A0A3L8S8X0_CHLGU|nr:hypothetical protein DV515_00010923 [Chloebia gouldiae]